MSMAFLITPFVIVATPVTGGLYTLAAGLSRGARASVLAAFACTLGTLPHLLAAITGLAALLHASGVAFRTVKYPSRQNPIAVPGATSVRIARQSS
jgi:threonine/homoserine/homoserine lactone efflux protein